MKSLSEKSYANAVLAAQCLRAAERPIRILRSVNWGSEHKGMFLRADAQILPTVEYPKFDAAVVRENTKKARDLVAGDHPILSWLRRTADTLDVAASMLENMGRAEFHSYSAQLYGTPSKTLLDGQTRTIDLARHMDASLQGLDFDKLVIDGEEEMLNARQFAGHLSRKLSRHFDGQEGGKAPTVVLVDNLSAKALAGAKRIRINANAKFTKLDVRQLLHHEALVHVATALNGRAQGEFPILGAAHAGTTEIQEGLAVFAEIISGAMDPVRFRRLGNRVIAIHMAEQGADFIEVYRYFLERNPDKSQSFEDTRRVFRGGVITGGAPFTKDGVYLNGLLRVHNFMRTVIQMGRGDLIRLLFVGKLDIEDVPALASLAVQDKLVTPKTLPPWVKDMRFLVSYLAYSSFLNQVKLPGFQTYYQDRLANVPNIWEFA